MIKKFGVEYRKENEFGELVKFQWVCDAINSEDAKRKAKLEGFKNIGTADEIICIIPCIDNSFTPDINKKIDFETINNN